MARPLRPCSRVQLTYTDAVIRFLRRARFFARHAGCPQTLKKVRSALKSAEGAKRHARRRHDAVVEAGR